MVLEYIEKQQSPQKEICKKLRKIILEVFPPIKEEMKYGVPYYNNRYYIVALKDHVNLGFSIKNLTEDEISFFEGTGKLTRHIKINSLSEIDENRIIKLLNLVNSKK
jgi:uncharacterized protein YdhG (YjbR/CyaY superfamily)